MKHLYIILIFMWWGCGAQSPVKSLYDDFDINDAYYKDTFNDYEKFVGTWKYTDGSAILTIVLQKKIQQQVYKENGDNYFVDFVIGGYKYMVNGSEKINTIPQLSQNLDNPMNYHISGYVLAGPDSYYCLNCGFNERVLILGFTDPTVSIFGMDTEMLFKRVDTGGTEKLELDFRTISAPPVDVEAPETGNNNYSVPFGKYILTKLN